LSGFAYVYNSSAQTVPVEGDVTFDSNSNLLDITHTPGTAQIILGSAGTYAVFFMVAGTEVNQFTIHQNGAPVTSSVYGSAIVAQQNSGMAIVTAAAGDVLTIRNHTSPTSVTLLTLAGGTEANVNASVLIEKLSD
jgi:hypothetical protein